MFHKINFSSGFALTIVSIHLCFSQTIGLPKRIIGWKVEIDTPIWGDIVAIARSFRLMDTVMGDLVVFAGDVDISDAVIFGRTYIVAKNGSLRKIHLKDRVYILGSRIFTRNLEGDIPVSIKSWKASIRDISVSQIQGTFSGSTVLENVSAIYIAVYTKDTLTLRNAEFAKGGLAGGKLVILDSVATGDTLYYMGKLKVFSLEGGPLVQNSELFERLLRVRGEAEEAAPEFLRILSTLIWVLWLVSSGFLLLIFWYFFPDTWVKIGEKIFRQPVKSFIYGLIMIISLVGATLLSIASVIGIPLAMLFLLCLLIMVWVSLALNSAVLACIICSSLKIFKKVPFGYRWIMGWAYSLLVGAALVGCLHWLKLTGFIIYAVISVVVLGGLIVSEFGAGRAFAPPGANQQSKAS